MAAGFEAGYEVGFDHLSMHLPHCVTVRNSLFYKFANLHLSISSRACRSYPHPHFRLYFIAGYIVTLCDVV